MTDKMNSKLVASLEQKNEAIIKVLQEEVVDPKQLKRLLKDRDPGLKNGEASLAFERVKAQTRNIMILSSEMAKGSEEEEEESEFGDESLLLLLALQKQNEVLRSMPKSSVAPLCRLMLKPPSAFFWNDNISPLTEDHLAEFIPPEKKASGTVSGDSSPAVPRANDPAKLSLVSVNSTDEIVPSPASIDKSHEPHHNDNNNNNSSKDNVIGNPQNHKRPTPPSPRHSGSSTASSIDSHNQKNESAWRNDLVLENVSTKSVSSTPPPDVGGRLSPIDTDRGSQQDIFTLRKTESSLRLELAKPAPNEPTTSKKPSSHVVEPIPQNHDSSSPSKETLKGKNEVEKKPSSSTPTLDEHAPLPQQAAPPTTKIEPVEESNTSNEVASSTVLEIPKNDPTTTKLENISQTTNAENKSPDVQKEGKKEQVVVEKNGAFVLVDADDLSATGPQLAEIPPQRTPSPPSSDTHSQPSSPKPLNGHDSSTEHMALRSSNSESAPLNTPVSQPNEPKPTHSDSHLHRLSKDDPPSSPKLQPHRPAGMRPKSSTVRPLRTTPSTPATPSHNSSKPVHGTPRPPAHDSKLYKFTSEEAREAFDGWCRRKEEALGEERRRKHETTSFESESEKKAAAQAVFDGWLARKKEEAKQHKKSAQQQPDASPTYTRMKADPTVEFNRWVESKQEAKHQREEEERIRSAILKEQEELLDARREMSKQAVSDWFRKKKEERMEAEREQKMRSRRMKMEARRIKESLSRHLYDDSRSQTMYQTYQPYYASVTVTKIF